MEKVLDGIVHGYRFVFPDGYFYEGWTSEEDPEVRGKTHIDFLKLGVYENKQVQDHYNKTKQLPEFILLKSGDEYTIRCDEYYRVDKEWGNPKLLNINKPYKPHILKILLEQGYEQANKQYNREYNQTYNKTKLGILTRRIGDTGTYIKKYTKLEKWDKVEEWKKIRDKRIKEREEYKSSLDK